MLSISRIKRNAKEATQYYLHEEKDKTLPSVVFTPDPKPGPSSAQSSGKNSDHRSGYYLAEHADGDATRWAGQLAEHADWAGKPVTEQQLEQVLEGQLGDTIVHSRRQNHRPGFDITLSAPKSVSILALEWGDQRLLEAEREAVHYVMNVMEKMAAQAKHTDPETGATRFTNTGALLFALVPHKTSRENDPQLHTHMLMANMTRDADGRLRALATCRHQDGFEVHGVAERIYTHQKYFTALYQSHLANSAKRLGYDIRGVGNGQFEIDGMPEDLLAAKSTRRQQITAHAERLGLHSQAAMEVSTLATRRAKQNQPMTSLLESWQAVSRQYSFDGAAFIAKAYEHAQDLDGHHKNQPPGQPPLIDSKAQEALDRTIRHHSDTRTTLNYETLINDAVGSFALDESINAIAVKDALDQAIQDGQLIALNDNRSSLTTQALLQAEQALLTYTQRPGQHRLTSVDPRHLKPLGLTDRQVKSVTALLESRKPVSIIQIRGDHDILANALLHAGNTSKRRVRLVTSGRLQQDQVKDTVKHQAFSFTQWLRNTVRSEHVVTLSWLTRNVRLASHDVLIVEDAQKLGIDDTRSVLDQAQQAGSQVIFIHDIAKRQGFKAGHCMEVLAKGSVLKQRWVSSPSPDIAIKLHEHRDDTRTQALVDAYAALSPEQQSHTQLLVMNHRSREAMNRAMRERLQQAGIVGRAGMMIETLQPVFMSQAQRERAANYRTGMILTEWVSQHGQRIKQRWTVEGIRRSTNTLRLIDEHGKRSTRAMHTKAAQARDIQVWQKDTLSIAHGDKLRTTTDHYASGLTAHQGLTVKKAGRFWVTVIDDQGKTHRLTHAQLHEAPLHYDYARTVTQADPSRPHTWLNLKAYQASSNLLREVLHRKTQTLTVFTDQADRLRGRLQQTNIPSSAIKQVIQSAGMTEKWVQADTADTLIRDVQTALQRIDQSHQAPDPGLVHHAVTFALNKIGERQAGFQHQALVCDAINYAFQEKGQALTQEMIEHKLEALKAEGQLFSVGYQDGVRWTTREALAIETTILERLSAGRRTVKPLVTDQQANTWLQQQTTLTDGQKHAIHLITTTADRHVAIQGFAGTGKSTMLASGIALVRAAQTMITTQDHNHSHQDKPKHTNTNRSSRYDNVQFVGLAPTHAAVRELKEKGVAAHTLQSLLSDGMASHALKKGQHTVFLLDEASMTSNQQIDQLLTLVDKADARVVYLGDQQQLTSIDAGKPFELAMRRGAIEYTVMKDIVRQSKGPLLDAAKRIIDHQPEQAMQALQQQTQHPHRFGSSPAHPDADQLAPKDHPSHVITISVDSAHEPLSKTDRIRADDALSHAVANDYLTRTPACRDNTLIIAYSNVERDAISQSIREGLQQRGLLDTKEVNVRRLRALDRTRAELTTMTAYEEGLILTIGQDRYYVINEVNHRQGLIAMTDTATGHIQHLCPARHNNAMTQLWVSSSPPLAKGDAVMLRRTDKSRGWRANHAYTVTAMGERSLTLTDRANQTVALSYSDLRDAHWDYRYTRTADLAQGATFENVITMIRAKAMLTNRRRAYIDITRAAKHVKVFTDSADKTILAWINHPSEKSSALDTLAKVRPDRTKHFAHDDRYDDNKNNKGSKITQHPTVNHDGQRAAKNHPHPPFNPSLNNNLPSSQPAHAHWRQVVTDYFAQRSMAVQASTLDAIIDRLQHRYDTVVSSHNIDDAAKEPIKEAIQRLWVEMTSTEQQPVQTEQAPTTGSNHASQPIRQPAPDEKSTASIHDHPPSVPESEHPEIGERSL